MLNTDCKPLSAGTLQQTVHMMCNRIAMILTVTITVMTSIPSKSLAPACDEQGTCRTRYVTEVHACMHKPICISA